MNKETPWEGGWGHLVLITGLEMEKDHMVGTQRLNIACDVVAVR